MFSSNNLIINGNGNTIMNDSDPLTVSTDNISVGLVFVGTTWRIY
jgi:hypothetical protein